MRIARICISKDGGILMSKEAIKELINAAENIKKNDYELFILLKNHFEYINLLAQK